MKLTARMKFIAQNSESGASGKDCLETLLAVKNLSVAYHGADGSRQQAVENASFEIGTGEVLGLMGESGCGKTSIALALLGLLAAGLIGFHQFKSNILKQVITQITSQLPTVATVKAWIPHRSSHKS